MTDVASQTGPGPAVTRSGKLKLLEERPSGPRGGARYHTTRTGRAALKRVAAHLAHIEVVSG